MMVWMVAIGATLLLVMLVTQSRSKRAELSVQQFWTYINNGDVVGEIIIREETIEGSLAAETPGLPADQPTDFYIKFKHASHQNFDKELREAIAIHGKATHKYRLRSWWEGMIGNLLVMGLIFFGAWFLLFRRIGSAGGGGGFLGNFGRSKHRMMTKEHTNVTFDDVGGIDEAKEEVSEIVQFLKKPSKFHRLGGRIPRGVLLVGAPGCGKTHLAKAIAGEADVPFFLISGSDFVEMFVGVGASRVRDLFKQAKDSAPCIIFLDEIDAVGRKRGVGFNGGGHDEREQTLNAILVEMDGFDSSDQVIVIAATNRMDVLDPALTRPGRFDRQITISLPDIKGRVEILKIHTADIKCGPDLDLHRLARGTPMFSGADLAALINEATIAATLADKDFVEQADMEEARDRVRWGRARKSRVIDEHEREMTAYHEAGHAIVQVLIPEADPLHKVSIIPRGDAGGATFSLPEKDRYLCTRKWCEAFICVSVAGRIAEATFCGDVDSGAASDIAGATELARRMVKDWGMSDQLGFVRYAPDQQRVSMMETKDYSEQTAEIIDREVKAIMDNAISITQKLLGAHKEVVGNLAKALLKYETLSADEVTQIIEGKELSKPTVGELLEVEASKIADAPEADKEPPETQAEPGSGPIPQPG